MSNQSNFRGVAVRESITGKEELTKNLVKTWFERGINDKFKFMLIVKHTPKDGGKSSIYPAYSKEVTQHQQVCRYYRGQTEFKILGYYSMSIQFDSQWDEKINSYYAQTPLTITEKECVKCKITKPASSFRKSNTQLDGLYAWCNDCIANHDTHVDRTISYQTSRHASDARNTPTNAASNDDDDWRSAYYGNYGRGCGYGNGYSYRRSTPSFDNLMKEEMKGKDGPILIWYRYQNVPVFYSKVFQTVKEHDIWFDMNVPKLEDYAIIKNQNRKDVAGMVYQIQQGQAKLTDETKKNKRKKKYTRKLRRNRYVRK